jgi:glycosyltransferase involved in cell wall biosynthesis
VIEMAGRGEHEGGRAAVRPSRILWVTQRPLPAVRERQGLPPEVSCGWLLAGLDALVAEAEHPDFVCATRSWPAPDPFESGGARYVTIPSPEPLGGWRGVSRAWTNGVGRQAPVDELRRLIDEVRPDLVHMHGTESPVTLGVLLAARQAHVPALVSLQGVVSEIAPVFSAGLTRRDVLAEFGSLEFLKGRGISYVWRSMERAAVTEVAALEYATDVCGRTDWDRDVVRRVNATARYWHVDEVMRTPFYHVRWHGGTEGAPTILAVTSAVPYKGIDVLLNAFARIRASVPCRLRVVGQIVGTPLWRSVSRLESNLGLTGHVEWAGSCEADVVADMLSECDVFVCASRIENSSNSICEAMLVGAPVVASRVGGTPSLVADGEDGLLFESGDDEALGRAIMRILDDDDLAQSLGSRARATALTRHDPTAVARSLGRVYSSLVAGA